MSRNNVLSIVVNQIELIANPRIDDRFDTGRHVLVIVMLIIVASLHSEVNERLSSLPPDSSQLL